jgi:phenol 2-monooxygenase (NADPH)
MLRTGMNTGIHDIVSLSWRLAGTLKGWFTPEVLPTYSTERHASSTHLIENDKVFSNLIARKKPDSMKDDPRDPLIILHEFINKQASFTTGLGISYEPNILNDVENSYPPTVSVPGHRGPDALIHKAGHIGRPIRLFEATKHKGKFHIVVFAGSITETRQLLRTLRAHVDQHERRFSHAVDFVTIIAGMGNAFDEHLGVRRFGNAYWDLDHSAHRKYGIRPFVGAIVVLRPDGIMGFVAELAGFENVVRYLERLIVPREVVSKGHAAKENLGEFMGQNEDMMKMSMLNSGHTEEGAVGR